MRRGFACAVVVACALSAFATLRVREKDGALSVVRNGRVLVSGIVPDRGDVQAGGDVDCDDVAGHLNAGGNVDCGNVEGNLSAGGNVVCRDVKGSVSAGGSVVCKNAADEVQSDGDFRSNLKDKKRGFSFELKL